MPTTGRSRGSRRTALPKVDYLDRVDADRRKEIDAFLDKVNVKIKDYNLINRALSHKSFTNEKGYSHNEQSEKLEFFGDGVLGMITNEYLFKVFSDCEEGVLAKIKSAAVSEVSLANIAREIKLSEVILLGRSEVKSGGADRPSLLCDILEAFIGAIYIDQGLPTARKFILRYFESSIRSYSNEESTGDYKSFLQEMVQKEYGERPVYTILKSSGPDHSRTFRVSVNFGGEKWGNGSGKSKKEAEQEAAEDGYKTWKKADEKAPRKSRPATKKTATKKTTTRKTAAKKTTVRKSGDETEKEETRSRRAAPVRRSRAQGARPRKKIEAKEEMMPSEIDDPVAWAAGETITTRRVPRKKTSTPRTKKSSSRARSRKPAKTES
ncbi:MAG: ribonuclease III [Candidatus Lindowbacteria bacterium]|nr:ribonuclease III [Candidatus Lindowbacteria bacterium]